MTTERSKRDVRWFVAASGVMIAVTCSPASGGKIVYYANSCLDQESGDISGYVVIVKDDKPFPAINLSWSEGALMEPVAAQVTRYDPRSGKLSFSVPIKWGEGQTRDIQFDGKFARNRMTGKFAVPWQAAQDAVELKVRSRKAAFEPAATCQSG